MDIITGYLGEPHVTSDQDRDINIGIVGDGSYVMPTGQRIAAEVSNNNEIRIRDGLIIHQGCAASIKKNTYDSVTITNGSQGMKRIDLIVARYQREVETNKETITLVVIQGTPAESDPAVPEHIEGDIQAGDSVADMPLYQVVIDGLNITEVKKVFEEITSLKELNSKISNIGEELTYSENGWTLTYRDVGSGFLYITAARTANKVDSGATYTEIYNLPFNVPFQQKAVVSNNVGPAVVGNGVAIFSGNRMQCQYQEYGSPVTNLLFGLIKISG